MSFQQSHSSLLSFLKPALPLRKDLHQEMSTKEGSDGTVNRDADVDKVLGCWAGVCGSAATVPVVVKEQHKSHQRPRQVQSKTAWRGLRY
jgi:hypothetical protein